MYHTDNILNQGFFGAVYNWLGCPGITAKTGNVALNNLSGHKKEDGLERKGKEKGRRKGGKGCEKKRIKLCPYFASSEITGLPGWI